MSYCSFERSEIAVDLAAVFLRVIATSKSRPAAAETENRRGSEGRRCFLSFPTSPLVTDCLRIRAAFQSLDNTRGAGTLDEPDVDRRVVEFRANIVLE